MLIHHIAGYKFISLTDTETLRFSLLEQCRLLEIKGTILLSHEGMNVNLAGATAHIDAFLSFLRQDLRFNNMRFRISHANHFPYKRLKVKIKKEIITIRQPKVDPVKTRAPAISPATFKQWLDEKRDITILDTRNDYEIEMGAFSNAINLHLQDFCEFPNSVKHIARNKPVVMYCTGGIRCEKAALHLINEGFTDVYQLDGGILNYFESVGKAHYEGECYVFDERGIYP